LIFLLVKIYSITSNASSTDPLTFACMKLEKSANACPLSLSQSKINRLRL